MRRYSISYLSAAGDCEDIQRGAPALPALETAFSAFGRGTLIATANGPVAVEDLLPGDKVRTLNNGEQTLLWRGSITHVPTPQGTQQSAKLVRVSADSLGLGRPMPDLLLGTGANIFKSAPSEHNPSAQPKSATELVDGEAIFEINPVSATELFHLAFADPQVIIANGIECQSLHPESLLDPAQSDEMRQLFMSMFPHISAPVPRRPFNPRELLEQHLVSR